MLARNLIGIVAAAATYLAVFVVLSFLQLEGQQALALLVGFHMVFGAAGYFVFAGRTGVRALCVFVVVLGHGVAIELASPAQGHVYAQAFVAAAFGVLSAISVYGGGLLARLLRAGRRGGEHGR